MLRACGELRVRGRREVRRVDEGRRTGSVPEGAGVLARHADRGRRLQLQNADRTRGGPSGRAPGRGRPHGPSRRGGGAMTVERLDVSVYRVPTEEPESDGTLTWDSTTVVVAEPYAEGIIGLGFTYGPAACATLIEEKLRDVVVGRDPMDTAAAWEAMVRSIRNVGRPGVASMAIAAVDTALWDLKARVLRQPLARLIGMFREEVPLYGSGGFTSYSDERLAEQLGGWVHDRGISRVKIKIGEDWGSREERDLERVALARKAIGDRAELFVDANGGYTRKQAVRMARALSAEGVTWFEEPVSSDDLEGLREIRYLIDID